MKMTAHCPNENREKNTASLAMLPRSPLETTIAPWPINVESRY